MPVGDFPSELNLGGGAGLHGEDLANGLGRYLQEVKTAIEDLEAASGGGTFLGYSERTSNFAYTAGASPQVLPADTGDLGVTGVAVPDGAQVKVTVRIPQFQVGNNFVANDDITFELGNADFSVVYGAHEVTQKAVGPEYKPVEFTSLITDPPADLDLKLRLAVPNGRSILEAGGYKDATWQAPAYMLVEAVS